MPIPPWGETERVGRHRFYIATEKPKGVPAVSMKSFFKSMQRDLGAGYPDIVYW